MIVLKATASLGAAVVAVGVLAGHPAAPAGATQAQTLTVYKSPTCGCCAKWVDHLKAAGFKVEVHDQANIDPVKMRLAVPENVWSCHTAVVDGYVVEGHVPAELIKRFLAERPAVRGLAVPGMPVGSPGMEGPSPQDYDVVTFEKNGNTTVYAVVRHPNNRQRS